MSSIWTVRRSARDAKVAGLCGGVAEKWDVDPILVRIAFVLLALSAGIGLVLYLAGWLLLPVEGSQTAPVDDLFGETVRKWPKELWIALVTVVCMGMLVVFGSLSPFSIGPAVVIAVIWYFGFYKGRRSRPGAEPPVPDRAQSIAPPPPPEFVTYSGPPTPFTKAAEEWRRRIEENAAQAARSATAPTTPGYDPTRTEWPVHPAASPVYLAEPDPEAVEHSRFLATADPVGLYADPVPVAPPAPVLMADRLSARRLRLVSLIVLGLSLAGLGTADYLGVRIPLVAYFAVALLVLGLTLLAATWLGRARGLLPLTVPLTIAVLVLSATGPVLQTPQSFDTTRSYATSTALPAGGDAVDVGRLTVDLSRLALDSDTTYAASVDVGELKVVVPRDTNLVINYAADMGSVHAFGAEVRPGSKLTGTLHDPRPALPGRPTLTLDLSIDLGNLEVSR
jgi:phage shock protein PspC (stress-responsive transcriptional regulator)